MAAATSDQLVVHTSDNGIKWILLAEILLAERDLINDCLRVRASFVRFLYDAAIES